MSWKNEPRYWKDNIKKITPPKGSPQERLISAGTGPIGAKDIGAEATLKQVYAALKGGGPPNAAQLIKLIETGYPEINQEEVVESASMSRIGDGTGAP